MTVLDQLNEQNNFTENERQIASYLLKNEARIVELSIRALAKESYVSASAIVRFYQKLGFDSYKLFIIHLTKELDYRCKEVEYVDANFPFSRIDSDAEIAMKIAKLSSETIYDTQRQLDEQSLTKATDYLLKAHSIYGIGVSHSFNRLMDFHTKMLRIRKYVKLMTLQSDQYHLTDEAHKGDAVLAISYGGSTAEIINDTREFKRRGVKTIAVTSNTTEELAMLADVILPLPKRENPEENISTFVSQIAIEYVLNTLYSCVYKRNYQTNIASIRPAPTSFLK